MSQHRQYEIVLKEAELMASAPEVVSSWFKEQPARRWAGLTIDDQLEENLLSRNDRLIDITLARYGCCTAVLKTLFERDDEVLKASVLANENHLRWGFGTRWEFAGGEDDLGWVTKLSDLEREALFSNRQISDRFLSEFFEQKGFWLALGDGQRFRATQSLVKTILALPDLDTHDFDLYYDRSLVYDSAWQFSGLIEVTTPWAAVLSQLYLALTPDTFSDFDPLDLAKRWRTPGSDEGNLTDEKTDNQSGYLSIFQEVRCGLARLKASNRWKEGFVREELLEHEDLAIRCGAYIGIDLTTDEVRRAVERDGLSACRKLLANDSVWKKEEIRSIVEEACGSQKIDYYLLSLSHAFSLREAEMREKYPRWFEEPIENLHSSDEYTWQDKPLSEAFVADIRHAIITSDPIRFLKSYSEKIEKNQKVQFWIIISVLLIIAFKLGFGG